MKYLTTLLMFSLLFVALLGCRRGEVHKVSSSLSAEAPDRVAVFEMWEAMIGLPESMNAFATLGGVQANDAYDADRDGRYVRIIATATHESGDSMRIPGFAMKRGPSSPWTYTVRWSAPRMGEWRVIIRLEGNAGDGFVIAEALPIRVQAIESTRPNPGHWVAPEPGQNPSYLRERLANGSTQGVWAFGTCRAWTVRHADPNGAWGESELIDRSSELLDPMRKSGMNLLNQWMAPWEYLLVHHAPVEHWEDKRGYFESVPVPESEKWVSHMYVDQGRAAAFDSLVKACEGGPGDAVIRLLLAPLPHPVFRTNDHPWHYDASFWSPWQNTDLPKSSMNGFCVTEGMTPWEFFQADPRLPLDDPGSQLFDAQANFFRYLIARWGYSSAIGAWAILDEIEGIGDQEAYLPDRSGYWSRPECTRWLNDTIRMFQGRLLRAKDGMAYDGDPYEHPVSAGCSSVNGDYGRGSNLDWSWGDPDAKPDLAGWHFYPPLNGWEGEWAHAWESVIAGVLSYADAPLGRRPRLITEFGTPERSSVYKAVSGFYPSIYHFGAWASIMSGHAGTVMDWNDGKEFGEFRWKTKGAYSKDRYPVAQDEEIVRIRSFLKGLSPDAALRVGGVKTDVSFGAPTGATALGLTDGTSVWGWCYFPDEVVERGITVRGLQEGDYAIAMIEPWTGSTVWQGRMSVLGDLTLDMSRALGAKTPKDFLPAVTREWKGRDLAFRISRRTE